MLGGIFGSLRLEKDLGDMWCFMLVLMNPEKPMNSCFGKNSRTLGMDSQPWILGIKSFNFYACA